MNLDGIKSEGAAKLEGASEAVRRGAKEVGRKALLVRQSATDHPLLSAAVGAAVAGGLWLMASGARRKRQARLAAGGALLGGALRKVSRNGKVARGLDGASQLGRSLNKWGRNQSLAEFARKNVGPALRQLLPLLAARMLSARRRFN